MEIAKNRGLSSCRYPQTLLGSTELDTYYDSEHGDYFFDTNPEAFESIFDFYLYGKIYQPVSIPNEMFQVKCFIRDNILVFP